MTTREQMLECIEEIEKRQARLESHDIWQDQLGKDKGSAKCKGH